MLIEKGVRIEQPKVSVIIPSFNCAKYISQAIESVINQTYKNYEIIVIDDGSTDNTQAIIKPYLNKIRYFYQTNQGVSEARNRGLDLARGELIAFLDADDLFLPHKLQEQVAIFEQQPKIGIVNSGFRVIKENGDAVMDVEPWHEIPDLTPEVWLLHKPVLPSAMMFRREWFDRVGGFNTRFFSSEDVEVTLRMVIQGCQGTWLPKITIKYRRHQNSVTWKSTLKQAKNSEEMQDYFFSRSDLPKSIRKLENQARFYHFSWLAWLCYQGGLPSQMAQYLEKSQQCAPYSWVEIIARWLNTFENCAKIYACEFDVYALSNLPEWQQALAHLKVLPLLKHYESKIAQVQQLLAYQPEQSEITLYGQTYFQLGQKLITQKELEGAIICLRQATELVPDNAEYQNALAEALQERYDLAEAIAIYRQAIRLQPEVEQFQQNLGQALQLQHRWQKLTDYCQQMLQASEEMPHHPSSAKPLKILMIFPFPPYPPQKGGAAIRMFEQIKYFGSRHHLTVVALIFTEEDYVIEEQLACYCERAFMVKIGFPMSAYQAERHQQLYFLKTWNMWKTLEQLSQIDFELVLFDFIVSTVYYPLFAEHFTILNEHNIESKLLQRCAELNNQAIITELAQEVDAAKPFLNAQREAQLLAEYENQTWCKFALRSVVSQDEQQELDRRCRSGKTLVVKNGIDTKTIVLVDNSQASKILFMGTMSYVPNIDAVIYFVEQIFSQIQSTNPALSLCIAGREPPSIIENLARANSNIEVIANPTDMSEVARDCRIAVVPLRLGSGTRLKILQALAMGLPVVSTSLGCEGLEVIDGQHLLIRDRPHEFAEAVLQLNCDRSLRDKLRQNGRDLVESQYDWSNIFSLYEQEILQQLKKDF
ncbi:glycosyl transferase family protein [Stanieria sp. NIES-3757]|nr:glycosyl transferase family protein [Stanieria sp. NIES-3757]